MALWLWGEWGPSGVFSSLFLSLVCTDGVFFVVGCEDESVRVTPVLYSLSLVNQSLSSFLVPHSSFLIPYFSFLISYFSFHHASHTHTHSLSLSFSRYHTHHDLQVLCIYV
jgi:hypothetical protein